MLRRILIIEDNRDIAELVRLHLADCADEVDVAHDGKRGLTWARERDYDLIILDLMLPGVGGMEICRRLRQQGRYTPILMLTAKSGERDRVAGLENGADDYLTKPFSVRELVARVRALFRRIEVLRNGTSASADEAQPPIRQGDLTIDYQKHVATLKGEPLTLTAREFELLAHFARHPGRVYRREQLLNQVWGAGAGKT